MELRKKNPITSGSLTRKYLIVLAVLLGLLLFHPMLPVAVARGLLLGAIIVSAWLVKADSPYSMVSMLVLSIPSVILIVLDALHPAFLMSFINKPVGRAMTCFSFALLVYSGIFILKALIASSEISKAEILGTVNLFIILGFMWAFAYNILSFFMPVSFNGVRADRSLDPQLIYFSFVTLTTLGYGDIVPRSHIAQMLAVIEAIVGQFYVAVVVAYLVSRYINKRKAE